MLVVLQASTGYSDHTIVPYRGTKEKSVTALNDENVLNLEFISKKERQQTRFKPLHLERMQYVIKTVIIIIIKELQKVFNTINTIKDNEIRKGKGSTETLLQHCSRVSVFWL